MAIDPYSPCPCGSGKKLKFCCTDLAVDIEKVMGMIEGEQPHAALKHVEQLLQKQPHRASLLDLKASLELGLHEFDAADETINTFLEEHPQSASANAQSAILEAVDGSATEAVDILQDAIELLEDEMPQRVLEAIGAVGQALLHVGDLVAARAHLLLYAGIGPIEDNLAIKLLLRMNLQANLPLLLRDYLQPAECPEDASWRESYQQAIKLSNRGSFRRAGSILSDLRTDIGPEPAIVYSLALLRGWLADTPQLVAGLHEYAALDVPFEDATLAEALAQLLDADIKDPQIETVKLVYPVNNDDALTEVLSQDKRTEDYEIPTPPQEQEESPPPRSTHLLLDREIPRSGAKLARSDIPNVVAFLSVYGKRTDREAQLEVTADRDEGFEQVKALLQEIAGDTLGELTETEVLVEKPIGNEVLSWRWRLPNDTPPEDRRRLIVEQRREAILDRWTAASRGALDGKTPLEAADEPPLRVALAASVLIIEQAVVDPKELPLFAELRQKLRLPKHEPIDPSQLDLESVSLVRVPYLELAKLSEKTLEHFLQRLAMMGADLAVLMVSQELAGRAEHDPEIDLKTAFQQLIRLEPLPQQALVWIEKARAWSRSRNESEATWALLELQLAIESTDGPRVKSVLEDLSQHHLSEQGVSETMYELLYSAGLIAPPDAATPGRDPNLEEAFETVPTRQESALWTPGDPAPSPEGEGQGKKSAIWTP